MTKLTYTSFLMGGLGNQMFQIAKAFSESLKLNVDCKFRKFSSIGMEGRQPSNYINNIYKKITFTDEIINTERIYEPSWSFIPIDITKCNTNIEFWGYFQSSKNFLGYDDKIKELFYPDDFFLDKIKSIFPEINSHNTISIHVRRGDYQHISNILPIIDKSYIEKCVSLIDDPSHIFIFSNDKNWVKENLNFSNMTVVEGLEDYEELWMMSLCNNNILSNSSFSWWGAFLNKNEEKKVFCPSVWFGPDGEKNWEDIYENDWIRIQVEYHQGGLVCK